MWLVGPADFNVKIRNKKTRDERKDGGGAGQPPLGIRFRTPTPVSRQYRSRPVALSVHLVNIFPPLRQHNIKLVGRRGRVTTATVQTPESSPDEEFSSGKMELERVHAGTMESVIQALRGVRSSDLAGVVKYFQVQWVIGYYMIRITE